ncbi:thioredoxin [Blastomyces parvus]|uniref:Thioredoxin n=1 Tax=Blastomyces parvus TaxID=2060905 RepID=A0A2B7WKP4_9EURO|nr:thioredoxin [Blastomyces parvus]
MLPKTSLRALPRAAKHHIIRPQPLQPLLTTTTSTTTTTTTNIYTSLAPTVASFRPLSSLVRTASTAPSASSALRSLISTTATPLPLPLLQQTGKRAFSSSARRSFRPSAGNMVVHNLENRAAFDAAVQSTTAAGAASTSTGVQAPLIVIDCFATWCGPCKTIAPRIVELSKSFPSVGFYKVDVDECPDIAQELGVRAMPTFVFFKDGMKVDEVVGAVPPAIEAAITKHI